MFSFRIFEKKYSRIILDIFELLALTSIPFLEKQGIRIYGTLWETCAGERRAGQCHWAIEQWENQNEAADRGFVSETSMVLVML